MINKNPLRRVFCVCNKDRIHSEKTIPVWLPIYRLMPEPIRLLARLIGISWAWDGNLREATGPGYQRPAIEFRQPDPAASKTYHNAAASFPLAVACTTCMVRHPARAVVPPRRLRAKQVAFSAPLH